MDRYLIATCNLQQCNNKTWIGYICQAMYELEFLSKKMNNNGDMVN
jgi:hypothetical protein